MLVAWLAALPLRTGDDLARGDRITGGERGGVAVVDDADTLTYMVEMQVAAGGEDLQDPGLTGVADRCHPVGRGAAGALDRRGALGEGRREVDLEVADRTPGHAGTPVIGGEIQLPGQAAGGHLPRERPRLAQRVHRRGERSDSGTGQPAALLERAGHARGLAGRHGAG